MLEDIRVIELGTVITAPLAAMLLGDMGAEVIKVERPGGDPLRNSHGGAYDATYLAYNRNKSSVVLDLAAAADREIMRRLIADADVFIDNLRPGGLEKLDLGAATLRADNPRLVHCSISGFGSVGPSRDRPAYDTVALALSGIASLLVDPEKPESFGPTISDNVTGLYAANAILAALVERARTGSGRRIEVNMLHASMAFIGDAFTRVTAANLVPDRFTRAASSQSCVLRCADGLLLAIHTSMREKFWRALAAAADVPEMLTDPRFATHVDRARNYLRFRELLGAAIGRRNRQEWMQRLEAAGVPFAPIHDCAQALADPQAVALGVLGEAVHPSQGVVRTIRSPVVLDGAPLKPFRAPPVLDEDGVAVRARMTQRHDSPQK